MSDPTHQQEPVVFRAPEMQDGREVYHLIKSCPPLDLNSMYYYFIMCRDFSQHSCVAESGGRIIGYVSGYSRKESPGNLFIWQVAVSEKGRGRGLAAGMLKWILETNPELKRLETTISPSNQASQALFASVARHFNNPLEKTPFLEAEDFGGSGHEAEELYAFSVIPNND